MSEGKHKEQGLKNELKQSAESIKTKLHRTDGARLPAAAPGRCRPGGARWA